MAINWTIDQKKVIETRNKNILVSAAAGSGKTTVLSERVISKITDKDNPVDVDRILVLTFTRAAAREMKAKITKNLTTLAEKNPSDENLRRQLTLIHKAEITTIDSFCISIYKNYFEDIGADPKKRIVNDDELVIIRDRVMNDFFNEKYEEGSSTFLSLSSFFARNDLFSGLSDTIQSVVKASSTSPWPMEFFDSLYKVYEIDDKEKLESSQFYSFLLSYIDAEIKDMVSNYEYVIDSLDERDSYYIRFSEELPYLKAILNEDSFSGKREAINTALQNMSSLGKKKFPPKNPFFDDRERDKARDRRQNDKKRLGSIFEDYFFNSEDDILKIFSYARPYAKELIELSKEYYLKYQAEKEKERVMDFSDVEHMALEILLDKDTKQKRPASIELSEYYDEIMVDEYQDSNDLQEAVLKSLVTETDKTGNYFCVGDVKQSIYRFRYANPSLFLSKYKSYDKEEGRDRLILLKQNFRSRKEVTDSVNHIFKELMKEDMGGLNYGEDESLNFAADFSEPEPSMKPEIHILSTGDHMPVQTARMYEAEMVCEIISNAINDLTVIDKDSGEKRKAGYGDIAILSRSLSSEMSILDTALSKHEIPHILAQKGSFFETMELRPVLSLLRLIDNRRDDISVAAVLRSPFYNVSDEKLLTIRKENKDLPFYSAVKNYAEMHRDDEVLNQFFYDLKTYRKKAKTESIKNLISDIYDTGYLDFVTAYPGGDTRRENLISLLDMAADFEKDNFKGLYRFNKYIELRKKYGVETDAEAFSSKDEVTIMTIHKSKGLEFPIVILFGAEKNFKTESGENGIFIDRETGLFVDAYDGERRIREKTFFRNIAEKKQNIDKLSEEQRLLYVALTRAKEKLFITGFEKDQAAFLDEYENALPITTSKRINAKNYFDFILPVACSKKYGNDFIIKSHDILEFYDENMGDEIEEIQSNDDNLECDLSKSYESLKKEFLDFEKSKDFIIRDEINDRLSFSYPYLDEVSYKTKYSVTEIRNEFDKALFSESENIYKKDILDENEKASALGNDEEKSNSNKPADFVPTIPEFMQEKDTLSGNKRGSAVHRFMECFDFANDDFMNSFDSELKRMTEKGMLSKEGADSISKFEIEKFLKNPLALRMHNASKENKLFREKAFMAKEKISDLLPGHSSKNEVMVQGIIDAFFIENGHIILIDYKTDRTKDLLKLKSEYFKQLDIYRDVLSRALNMTVSEMMLYSFTIGAEIPLL